MILSAFQFGSLPMLGWLAAALLPWLIHRMMRQRHQTTSWAAVELLLVAVQQQARRVYFQQWLLLAVRTLIVALVALAVAEPFWRTWGYGAGDAAQGHLILVVDQSYSMSCREENQSRFDRAKQYATQLLNENNDGITSVIGWSKTPHNPIGRPTAETSIASAAIEGLQQQHDEAGFPQAVRAASAAIDRAEQDWPHIAQHHVVFISDQTKTTWSAEETSKANLTALAARASLASVDVGDQQRNNLAVIDVSADTEVILRQHPLNITTSLQAFGPKEWDNANVELKIDGQVVATESITIPAGSQQTVTFPYQFADEGRHTLQVSVLNNDDALPLDDRRWLVVDVRPRLKIACVEGFPKAAADVARALKPFRSPEETDNTIQLEVVPESQLIDLDLSQVDAIFLCSVQELTEVEQSRLANYVRSGGGLAMLAGESTNINGELSKLLPVEIGAVVSSGSYQIDPLDYEHAILNPFRGQVTSGLQQVAVAKYRQLSKRADRKSAQTVLAFNSGDPALVVEKIGAGRVAVLAIPATLAKQTLDAKPWSTLPVSPSFLPLVRELVGYLAGDARLQQQNVLVNQPAVCSWDLTRRSIPIDVRGPDNRQFVLPAPGAEDRGQVVFAETQSSGTYTLSTAGEEFGRFAVNLDTRESDLTTIVPDSLPAELKANRVDRTQNLSLVGGSYSLVGGLLMLAILLLLAENALACWQGRAWQ